MRQVFWISRVSLVGVLITAVGLAAIVGGGAWAVLQQLWPTQGTFRLDLPGLLTLLFGLAVFVGVLAPQIAVWLVVSPAGLEYHVLGLTVLASWADVTAIENVRFVGARGGWSEEGLRLSRSRLQGNRLWAGLSQASRWDHFIPLTRFSVQWRTTDLGDLIFRHAPQLHNSD